MGKYIDEKEIFKLVAPEVQKICGEIANDITGKALEAISAFYVDYGPKVYQRAYAMPGLLNDPKISQTANDKYSIVFIFSGGEEANDGGAFMTGVHGSEGAGNIFDGPFVQGYHGPPWGKGGKYPAPRLSPSPWERIRDYAMNTYNAKPFGG